MADSIIKSVGVLGGGQLALLLAQAASKLGLSVLIYAQDLSEPACSIAFENYIGAKDDSELLLKFFKACDFIVLESEFYHPKFLLSLEEKTLTKVYPSLSAYQCLYSKENQKIFFDKNKIPVVQYLKLKKVEDIARIDFPGPYMIKLSTGGYDGYGNFEVSDKEQLSNKIEEILSKYDSDHDQVFIVEQKIEIKNEYAAMLFKSQTQSLILPPCQSFQEDSICRLVKFPSGLSEEQNLKIMKLMNHINDSLEGCGVFAFEFFEDGNGEIIVNEAAPRVHNSYHFTIEAFEESQFDLFFNAILNKNLIKPKQRYSFFTMVNLLGQSTGENYELKLPQLDGEFDYKVHMYGKKLNKPGRKMGHITFFGDVENIQIGFQVNKEYTL